LLFPVYLANGPTLYTSEKEGNDELGDGSLQKPFKTVMRVEEKWVFICMLTKLIIIWGCRDGAVVRALASHQCGLGSIPRSGVKCGLSWLVLFSAPRGFLWELQFPLSSKTKI